MADKKEKAIDRGEYQAELPDHVNTTEIESFTSAIQMDNLTKNYGDGKGIFDVSLMIKEGEVFGFLGPNGAGKTTTIRHLLGFIRPDNGACFIDGMDCISESTHIQKELGYIPGEIAFMDDMKGTDFIEFMARYRKLKDRSRIDELLRRFELDPRGKIKKMSKGMKQKIGIVCAFMHDPKFYILDEPTSGLDPLMQSRFVELILEEKKRGKTILMSSHMFEEIEKTCDRVAIIRQGKIVAVDDIDGIKASRRKGYVLNFTSEEEAERYASAHKDVEYHEHRQVTVKVQGDVNEFIRDLGNYQLEDLDVSGQSLEEAFMHYYGGDQND